MAIADGRHGAALVGVARRAILPCLLIVVVAIAASSALFANETALKTTRAEPFREIVDVNTYPWSSIGKVNFAGFDERQSCTGSAIGPKELLTAAHCLYNARTPAHQLLPAGSIHFLLGFSRGEYRTHRVGARYAVSPKFEYDNKKAAGDDWAVIYVDEPFPSDIRPLRLATTRSWPGTLVETAGYSTYRSQVMTADKHCHVTAVSADGKLVFNDCIVRHGNSGGPLLGRGGDTEALILGVVSLAVSVDVPEENSIAVGVAVAAAPIAEFVTSEATRKDH
jgi:protease YdgD